MDNDPDALFPSGPTTRRGLLSVFGRRAAQALPMPNIPEGLLPPAEEDYFDEEPPEWIEPFLSGEDLVADIQAVTEEPGVHVWWLGQSGFLVQMDGERILLDPYLSSTMTDRHAAGEMPYDRITELVVTPELLSFVDVVACSNSKLDHLDPGTLPYVLAGDALFACPAGSEELAAERAGRQPDAALAPGDQAWLSGFVLDAVPAHHADAPGAVGYVVHKGLHAVYHAGDSRRVQGMAEAVAPFGVDAAFVPISGTNGTMDGADAARLAYEAGASIAIPCHYEMFRCDTASVSRFVAECIRIGQEYRLLRAGERLTIGFGS